MKHSCSNKNCLLIVLLSQCFSISNLACVMATKVTLLQVLCFSHVFLGFCAIFTGISTVNVTDYYSGVFAMGIWLGVWVCNHTCYSSYDYHSVV